MLLEKISRNLKLNRAQFCLYIFILFKTLPCISAAEALSLKGTKVSENQGMQTEIIEQEGALKDIKDVQKNIKIKENKAKLRKAEAAQELSNSTSALDKALNSYLTSLETFRINLSQEKLQLVNRREAKLKELNELTQELVDISKKIVSQKVLKERKSNFSRATLIWRKIVDETLDSLFEPAPEELSTIPKKPEEISFDSERGKAGKIKIDEALAAAEKEQNEYKLSMKAMYLTEREVRARLLLKAGSVRANLMALLISRSEFSVWNLDRDSLADYPRELKIVPYRFLATIIQKYYEFKSRTGSGPQGWIEISKEILLLVFVIIIPLLFFNIFKRFSSYLDNLRGRLFTNSSMSYRKRTTFALWISRLNPYLPWTFAYLALEIAFRTLDNTVIEPITLVIPYLELYIFYRIFQMIFGAGLSRILHKKS